VQTLTVYGKTECVDWVRSKALLDGFGVEYEYHDILDDPAAAERATQISGVAFSPVIVFDDGSFLVEPSDSELALKLDRAVPEGADAESCEIV